MRIFGGLIGDMVESVTQPIDDLFTDTDEVSKTKNKQSRSNQVAKESKESDYSFNNMMDLIIDSRADVDTKLAVLICFLKGIPELKRLTYSKDTYNRIKERLKTKE